MRRAAARSDIITTCQPDLMLSILQHTSAYVSIRHQHTSACIISDIITTCQPDLMLAFFPAFILASATRLLFCEILRSTSVFVRLYQ